jgi:hypothetical protein
MEEGWSSVGEKYVCPNCFDDYAIKDFIETHATACNCNYCENAAEHPIAAEMDEVLSFISEGLHREYEDPANSVGYCSAEGGYDIEPDSSYELFVELGFGDGPQTLFDDLVSSFSDCHWVHIDPYGLPEDEALGYSWEAFSEQVKHSARFVFFKLATSTDEYSEPEPYTILENIGKIVTRLALFEIIETGTVIVRARQHESTKSPNNATDLGSPPKESASQSRMSPAGIPMFYGAANEAIAFAETFSSDPAKPCMTFGNFGTLRPLTVLDLTAIPDVPSLFDPDGAHARAALSFMHNFEASATGPIPHDESQHYLYVPTQVVAEYFRHVFTFASGRKIDGIVFNSSRVSNGKCYTLFLDNSQCSDSATAADKTLVLSSFRKATIDFTNQTYT